MIVVEITNYNSALLRLVITNPYLFIYLFVCLFVYLFVSCAGRAKSSNKINTLVIK